MGIKPEALKRILWTAARVAAAAVALWATAWVLSMLGMTRSTAAMILVLEVLAIATRGDWILALLSSTAASLVFSFYFIEHLRTVQYSAAIQGILGFAAMALTALIGSRLAVRAQQRASEAIARREEIERLNQLGRVLLSANTVAEAADNAVRKVVELFHLSGAVLRVAGAPHTYQSGVTSGEVSVIPLSTDDDGDTLELHGAQPSEEVRNTVASMIRLVLERARGAEERAHIEVTRRGEDLRNTVLNALAHDFKTPLTSIKAASSMLRASDRIPSVQERDLVAVIDEEADRLDRLIRESLDMAKLEARRAHPMTEECNVPEIVRSVAAKKSRYFGRREFTVQIPDDIPPVIGDSFLFEQVLGQLLDNAWKYSKPGAPIRISAMVAGPSLVLTVWNEGSEIPTDERDRIFDRFYRGSKVRQNIEGTGLGLAIAKEIVEAHGGKIWLDAEPTGPAFRLQLPIEADAGAQAAAGRESDREQHYIAR
jgi:two-component system, OmpR family, sensor histidine kinase KdpD